MPTIRNPQMVENSTADVVVIGGGIVGCTAAYYLARRGASVILCEKGDVGLEQSSRNWGFVRHGTCCRETGIGTDCGCHTLYRLERFTPQPFQKRP